MYCTQCDDTVAESTNFCGRCGGALQGPPRAAITPVTVTAEQLSNSQAVPEVRPWVRYWARMFDICLFGFLISLLIEVVAPESFTENRADQLLGFMVLFIWVFIEALLLSTLGTTPGKWFFKTKITSLSGFRISYRAALSRSLKVWWRGLGAGWPIVSLITLLVAHSRLTLNSITSWDREGNFVVSHEKIGIGRVLAAIGFLIVIFVIGILVLVLFENDTEMLDNPILSARNF